MKVVPFFYVYVKTSLQNFKKFSFLQFEKQHDYYVFKCKQMLNICQGIDKGYFNVVTYLYRAGKYKNYELRIMNYDYCAANSQFSIFNYRASRTQNQACLSSAEAQPIINKVNAQFSMLNVY